MVSEGRQRCRYVEVQTELRLGLGFMVSNLSHTTPSSVHLLRPGSSAIRQARDEALSEAIAML